MTAETIVGECPRTPDRNAISKRKRDRGSDESESWELGVLDETDEEVSTQIEHNRREHAQLLYETREANERRRQGLITEKEFAKLEVHKAKKRLRLEHSELRLGIQPKRVMEKISEIYHHPTASLKVITAAMCFNKNEKWYNEDQKKGRMNRFKLKRDSGLQKKTMEAWGAISEQRDNKWCCFLGQWLHKNWVVLAHIVPHATNPDIAAHFFDTKTGEEVINDPANTMPLCGAVESCFDMGQWVVIPKLATNEDGSQHYKYQIKVLDQSLLNLSISGPIKWKDYDRKFLQFRTDLRPRKRYLFWHFITSIMVAGDRGFLHWDDILEDVEAWAVTPGKYVRRSVMSAMSRMVNAPKFQKAIEDAGLDHDIAGPTIADELISRKILADVLTKSLESRQINENTEEFETDDTDCDKESENQTSNTNNNNNDDADNESLLDLIEITSV